jgi:DNA-binding NtrC family response regulator
MVRLPKSGVVLIGRVPEAEVKLEHPSVSRKHARITVEQGVAKIVDLDSHNGTRVNGEPIEGARELGSGDVVTIGEVVLVVHADREKLERAPLDEAAWRRRLSEEIERSLHYGRPLAVVALAGVGRERAARAAVIVAIDRVVRRLDVIGVADDGQPLVLLPELDRAAALAVAAKIKNAAGNRVGVAACPDDAADVESILLAARAAARGVEPTRVALGDRSVLLAHPATLRVYDLIRRLAAADLPVLITGETGAGKENAAYAVHAWSARKDRPYRVIHCAALPETLVESELFGHEKGAFSGAVAQKLGLLEAADGGTIFLDEVGEIPLAVQAKLLRALEAQRITRLGSLEERPIDVRLVAATNRDLEAEVAAGRFRQDLFFRLSGAKVILPPLRERRAEIAVLARELLAQAARKSGRDDLEIGPAAMQVLLTYAWPGNVRELRNAMDYVAATAPDAIVEPEDLPEKIVPAAPVVAMTAPAQGPFKKIADELAALERQRMAEALEAAGGVRTKAAEMIGMPIRTFTLKLKQYGLGSPR